MKTLLLIFTLAIAAGFAAHASPETTFIDAYKQAYERSDVNELNKLRYLDGVPAPDRAPNPHQFNDFSEKISSIKIGPPSSDALKCLPAVVVRDGITYRFNLPAVASLQIEYVPGKDSSGSNSKTMLGLKDGRYWIPSLVPVTN